MWKNIMQKNHFIFSQNVPTPEAHLSVIPIDNMILIPNSETDNPQDIDLPEKLIALHPLPVTPYLTIVMKPNILHQHLLFTINIYEHIKLQASET